MDGLTIKQNEDFLASPSGQLLQSSSSAGWKKSSSEALERNVAVFEQPLGNFQW